MIDSTNSTARRGAVAVIRRAGRFLVIRRAEGVVAPGAYCFPGGGIEELETEEQALVREIREELGVLVAPLRRAWRHTTTWGVELFWWLADLSDGDAVVPNPAEVAAWHWLTSEEMLALPDLLSSNRAFLEAVSRGEVDLR